MAGLVEQAQWENEVYQIEQTDPVVGGPPDVAAQQGFTNVPHLHLANRTLWLKAQIEALQTALDNFDVSGDVQAAVDAVLDGAPGALDTLNELAAALGDDPNFAATITAQIATKLDAATYTAADVLAKIKTVDGPGSGLNADYLDGISSASFVQTSRTITAGTGLTGGGDLGANRTISANIATQAEAEAGTSNTKLMTPLRTKQVLDASPLADASWLPWDGGDDAEIWKHSVDGDTAIIESPTLEAGYDYRVYFTIFTSIYSNSYLEMFMSIENAWVASTSLTVQGGDYVGVGYAEFLDPASVTKIKSYSVGAGRFNVSGSDNISGGAISQKGHCRATAQSLSKFRLTCSAGVFSEGHAVPTLLNLYRRKSNVK